MKKNQTILAIIPARGGSKGVPRKNIKPLAGKPLLAWTIETALSASCLDRVILSTDDEEIADVGRRFGMDVPFLRPSQIAGDDTTDLPVYEHALQWLAENESFVPDIIVWLRPTAPLRTVDDIEQGVDLLIEKQPDWVRSVCEVEHHPYWMYKPGDAGLMAFVDGIRIEDYMRRQLLPKAFRLNGAVDVAWRRTILEKKLYSGVIQPHVMPAMRSVDIDTLLDFKIIEAILAQETDE